LAQRTSHRQVHGNYKSSTPKYVTARQFDYLCIHSIAPQRQSMICELLFPSSILAVKMNRKTLVIVLEAEIYIYDISNMRLQHVIETTPNPEAIVALSPSADNSYLAYPSPVPAPAPIPISPQTPPAQSSSTGAASGDVLLFSTKSLTVSQIIRAHKAPISALALNSTGTLLATASDKGTVIRVWGVPGAEKLYQFRRGTREARIYSLNFNVVGTLLAVSSAHDTVHIFKLGGGRSSGSSSISSRDDHATSPSGSVDSREGAGALEGGYDAFVDDKKKKSGGVSSSLRRRSLHLTKNITSSVGGYLPNTLTEMWEPSRDFAFLKLPTSGARCIVALSGCVTRPACISLCDVPLNILSRSLGRCPRSWLSHPKATSIRTASISKTVGSVL
jgi:autophagy-related protein 18